MPDSASLGRFISERRQDLGLTQEQLAERVGENVRQSDISRLERDRISLPRRERLEQLAAALEVSLGDLLVRTGWLSSGDDMAQNLDWEAATQVAAPPTALADDDVRALVQVIDTARTLIASALEALAAADAALHTTMQTLKAHGERGKIHPTTGVFRGWETSQVFPA
jgi:transcriptional regulator with XRE-family HTH domain